MYDPTSRYAGLPALTVTMPDGSTRVMSAPRTAPAGPGSQAGAQSGVQQVPAGPGGERLDLLAGRLVGDTTQWWRIADANPYADATALERPGGVIALPGGAGRRVVPPGR